MNVKQIQAHIMDHFYINGTYEIDPETGQVDVTGSVKVQSDLKQLPVQFGYVSGDFRCFDRPLLTLKGAPHTVVGNFICEHNKLTNLAGAPRRVMGNFNCAMNKLVSLQGAPEHVGRDFIVGGNESLMSLTHIPPHVGRSILVYNCALTSLAHMPEQVHGHCLVYSNKLTDLSHAPRIVQGTFDCSDNPLQSIQHAPEQIGGEFGLSYHAHMPLLRTLVAQDGVIIEGAPDRVKEVLNDESLKGRGKSAAIKATAALARAGFKENARW